MCTSSGRTPSFTGPANHSGTGTNTFQGEDLDVLAELGDARRDEQANPPGRIKCRPQIDQIKNTEVARGTFPGRRSMSRTNAST